MIKSKRVVKKNLHNTEFISRVINVARVSKTTSGGRRMSVSVLVVIGNEDGVFGFGLGNAAEVKAAEEKALRVAQNNLFAVPLKKIIDSGISRKTIYHSGMSKYCSSKLFLISAKPGTGIVAGPVVTAACECLGITDIVVKLHGSSNPHNIIKAFSGAVLSLKSPDYYKYLRGINVAQNE